MHSENTTHVIYVPTYKHVVVEVRIPHPHIASGVHKFRYIILMFG